MAFDGNGNFSVPNTFVYNTVISETQVNQNFSQVATGLSTAICKDGQTTITANIPFSGFKVTGLGSGSAAADSANLGQIQSQAYVWCGTAGGTADAITLSPSPAITAYAAGQRFLFVAASDNTTATTFNVSAQGTKAAQLNGSALSGGEIVTGKIYEIIYDGTQFQITRKSVNLDDLYQPLDGNLTAISGLTSAANKVPYFTGSEAAGVLDFLDEDDMSSDSATAVSSQQSIKAYVDTSVASSSSTTLMTKITSPGTTSVEFTSIPSGVKEVNFMVVSMETSGSSDPLIQIGDSGGFETSGYLCNSTATLFTTGFGISVGVSNAVFQGHLRLLRVDDNTWSVTGIFGRVETTATVATIAGAKVLSGELDRIRITTTGGTDTFTTGIFNVNYIF